MECKHAQDMLQELGKGRAGVVCGSGKALGGCCGQSQALRFGISAAPSVLVLNQAWVPDLFSISMKPVPDVALPGQLRKLWEAGREEEHPE